MAWEAMFVAPALVVADIHIKKEKSKRKKRLGFANFSAILRGPHRFLHGAPRRVEVGGLVWCKAVISCAVPG